jgi:hypothetical protein
MNKSSIITSSAYSIGRSYTLELYIMILAHVNWAFAKSGGASPAW